MEAVTAGNDGSALRHETLNPDLQKNVVAAVAALFPAVSADEKTRVEASNIRVDTKGFDPAALAHWQQSRQLGKTEAGAVYGDLTLVRDGKVTQRLNNFRLGQLPQMGALGTFMVGGNDYFTSMQQRLKPGTYTREKNNGEYETFIPTKGAQLKVEMDPATGVIKVGIYSSNVSWYSLVRALGVTDDQIVSELGNDKAARELVERNRTKNPDKDLEKFFRAIFEYKQNRDLLRAGILQRDPEIRDVDKAGQITAIKTWMEGQKLDPYVTKKTLGSATESLSPGLLVQAAKRLLDVSRETAEPDSRDSLEFKTIHHVEDMMPERIAKLGKRLVRKLMLRLGKPDTTLAKGFGANWLNPATVGYFGGTRDIEGGLANTAEAANPLAMLSEHSKVTLTGEGGIGTERAITTEARLFRPGNANFIDMVHTPEGCYADDTLVYTDRGWVEWPDVTLQTKLACNVDGKLEYHFPLKLICNSFDGDMIGYESARVNFLVTPEHRMYVRPQQKGAKFRIESAQSLIGKNRNVSCGGHSFNGESSSKTFSLPVVKADGAGAGTQKPGNPPIGAHLNPPAPPIDIVAWCRFLGWYLSEGHAEKYVTTVTQLHSSVEACTHIEKTLNALPFTWRRGGDRRFYISGKQLASYCKTFGNSRSKFIPNEVFTASVEARMAFLESALMGDGRKRTKGAGERGSNPFSNWICYCTTSKRLADDVYRLMFELGLSASISFEEDLRDDEYLGCYCVHIHSFNERGLFSKNHRHPDGQFELVPYSGKVYCAEVPGGLMFVKRGKGFGFWCGNSQIGVTTHTAWNTRKKGNKLEAIFLKVENGVAKTPYWLSAEEASDTVIGYPEYWNIDGNGKANAKLVRANKNGNVELVDPKEVKFVIPSGRSMFDHTSNASFFFDATSANRGMMSGKHMTQALPLTYREHPLATMVDGRGNSVMETLAKTFTVRSTVDGTVTKVTPHGIMVGNTNHEIFDHYPFQAKVALNHVPVVKVGDKVKKGQLIADSNYSKDGKLALGVNVRTAYMPWKNATNFEDAIPISETAAKKFSSEHVHREELELEPGITVDKKMTQAQFPTLFTADAFKALDDSGVVKEGSTVVPGQCLIAAIRKVEFDEQDKSARNLSSIHKILERPYRNVSVMWNEIFPATVYRVVRTPESIAIHLKTSEPMQVGDKLSMSSAAKGTVSAIIPDDKMPRTAAGEPIEVILSPHGVIGRINPSQTVEQAVGKYVKKTGKPYVFSNFGSKNDYAADIARKLLTAGIKHDERLFDPETGKWLERPVGVGYNYMIKLDHPVRKKFSARERDGYTMDETPTRGKGVGAQPYDHLTTYALLGHNAHAILGESAGIRGTKNDDFWHAYQAGETPPAPKVPFVFEKFRGFLNAAGVDTQQHGNVLHYLPMTEKNVRARSNGAITEATMIRSKDLAEEKGGLFDPKITGGIKGDKWAHIELNERIPHPLYEKTIRDITGIKTAEYYGLIAHTMFYNPTSGKFQAENSSGCLTGEAAFKKLLSFDIDDKLANTNRLLRTAVGSDANKLNRAARYLRGLKTTKLDPVSAYMTNVIPVLPPNYRPIIEMKGGALRVADANLLYRDVILTNDALKGVKDSSLPAQTQADARIAMYQSVGALIGVNNALTHRDDREDAAGLIDTIKGKSNKTGMFQRLITSHRNDYSGRSTIEPDANLGVDEIGIPEEMAWKIYKPRVVRRLSQLGSKPSEAMEQVEKRTLIARQALDHEMKNCPVLYNRAPSLHRWSIAAAFPHISAGKEVKISPIVVGPFGADYDGNCCIGSTVLTLMVDRAGCPAEHMEALRMRAAGSTSLAVVKNDSFVFTCRIDEVPFLLETEQRDKNGAYVYDAVPGLNVLTSDTSGRGVRFSPITKVTIEDGCHLVDVGMTTGQHVTVSDNESVAIFDHNSGMLKRARPRDSIGALSQITRVSNPLLPAGDTAASEIGWLIGAFTGDGFFMGGSGRVGFAKLDSAVRGTFERIAIVHGLRFSGCYDDVASESKLGSSTKTHFVGDLSSADTVGLFEKCYVPVSKATEFEGERAALRKVLPPFAYSSRAAAIGVLAGLLDTDGTVGYLNGKSKPQFTAQVATSSPFLRDSILALLRLLGIRGSFSTTQPAKGRLQTHESYTVIMSIVDLAEIASEIPIRTVAKATVMTALGAAAGSFKDDRDLVPLPWAMFDLTRDKTDVFADDQKALVSLRSVKAKSPFPAISRPLALRVAKTLEAKNLLPDWVVIARDTSVRWSRIETVEDRPTERVYDLEVPETKVFAVNDGLVIYDTMSVTPPITEAARLEAFNLLPSRNLFYDKDRTLAYGVSKDIISGIFALTKPGSPSGKSYATADDAIKAYHDNKDNLLMGSLVRVDGRTVAVGWLIFEKMVPARFLAGVSAPIDGKKLDKLLSDIASKSPGDYNQISRAITQAGFQYAALAGGITTTVDELNIDRTKVNRLLDSMESKIDKAKTKQEKVDVANREYKLINPQLEALVKDHLKTVDRGYHSFLESRSSSKIEQMKQMLVSPVLMSNVRDETVPAVIKSSYGQGMKPSDYVLTTPGSRKGLVARSLATALPGFLAKEVAGNVGNIRIYEKDCGTLKGIDEPLAAPEGIKDHDVDLLDRHLAADVGGFKRNDPVTPAMLAQLRDRGVATIKVRSPMTCEAPSPPCQLCAGRAPDGKLWPIGSNIGYNYGQGISERSTQLTMKVFHAGGTIGAGESLMEGFDRLKELLSVPEVVKKQGTLAQVDGTVTNTRLAPQGGYFVYVQPSAGGEPVEHHVQQGRDLVVKNGAVVKAGDALSNGNFRPQEIAQFKGTLPAQQYVVNQIRKSYQDAGATVRKPVIEVLAAGLMRTVEITDDGGEPDLSIGDVIHENDYQKRKKRNSKIEAKPVLLGLSQKPLESRDLLQRLNFQRLDDAIRDVPSSGGSSDLTGSTSPIPGLAYGAAFRPEADSGFNRAVRN